MQPGSNINGLECANGTLVFVVQKLFDAGLTYYLVTQMVITKVTHYAVTIVQQFVGIEHIQFEIGRIIRIDVHESALINFITVYIRCTVVDQFITECTIEMRLFTVVDQTVVTNGIRKLTVGVIAQNRIRNIQL